MLADALTAVLMTADNAIPLLVQSRIHSTDFEPSTEQDQAYHD